jgi:hypothetical protein
MSTIFSSRSAGADRAAYGTQPACRIASKNARLTRHRTVETSTSPTS